MSPLPKGQYVRDSEEVSHSDDSDSNDSFNQFYQLCTSMPIAANHCKRSEISNDNFADVEADLLIG